MVSQCISSFDSSREAWKPIPGYIGFYEASDKGSIRSVPRAVTHNRAGTILLTGKTLKPSLLRNGYLAVNLCVDQHRKAFKVHRLVLLAFLGECPTGMEACHKDGNKKNNAISNLRYDTRKNNNADKILHGTDNNGDRNHRAKLTSYQVDEIRRRSSNGEPAARIAKDFGISRRTASDVCANETWRTIDRVVGSVEMSHCM